MVKMWQDDAIEDCPTLAGKEGAVDANPKRKKAAAIHHQTIASEAHSMMRDKRAVTFK